MSIVLKRPMFRKGGSVSDGVGITSGLTHRKRFAEGSDNPMGDYVNTDDNDLYTNAQNADFSSSDIDREKAKEILKNIILKNIENEKSSTFEEDTFPISNKSDDKEVANDWMDYLSKSDQTPVLTSEPVKKIIDKPFDGPTITTEPTKKIIEGTGNTITGGIGINNPLNRYLSPIRPLTPFNSSDKSISPLTGQPINLEYVGKKTPPATITDERVSDADAYPIYNAQGQNITQSIINSAKILRQQMTPSEADNMMSFIRKFGSTAKGPLDLQTLGSALGETAEKVDVERQKSNQELNKYIGTIMGRTIGSLGKAGTQTSLGKLSGAPKIAFEKAVMSTGISPKTVEEAIADPIFMEAWKREQANLGEVTPQQKLERADQKTRIKDYKERYNLTDETATKLEKIIREADQKGISQEDRDTQKPYLRHAKDLAAPSANGIRYPAKNISVFEGPNAQYKPGKIYPDIETGKWYKFVKDPDGRNPRFEPLK